MLQRSADTKGALQEAQYNRKIKGKALVEAWGQEVVGEGLEALYESKPASAINTAFALTEQKAELERMSETQRSTSFAGLTPENVLKVVRLGVANSVRGDIFTEYSLQTTDDAFYFMDMVYEQSKRGATAGDKSYENISPYYAGEENRATIDASGSATTYTNVVVAPSSVIPWKVSVLVGGTQVGNDDGNGNLTFTGMNSSGTNTVDYATGRFDLAFTGAPGAIVEVVYNYDSENPENYGDLGTMGLTLSKKRFQARPMLLGYKFTTMLQIQLETTGMGDAQNILVKSVADEHARARDYRAIAYARSIAKTNPLEEWDADFNKAGEISYKEHAQRIYGKIIGIQGKIFNDLKRGSVNKAVCGTDAFVYLMMHDKFVPHVNPNPDGVHKVGTLMGIEVFLCPSNANLITSTEILLTYKNDNEGLDAPIIFGTLKELISAELHFPTHHTEASLGSIEDKVSVQPKFLRLLNIKNLV